MTQEEWYMVGLAIALIVIIAFFATGSSNFTIAMPLADQNGQINSSALPTYQDLTTTDNILQNQIYISSGGQYGTPPSSVGGGSPVGASADSDSEDEGPTTNVSSSMLFGGTGATTIAAGRYGGMAQVINNEVSGIDTNDMQDPTTYNALGALADLNSSTTNSTNTAVASLISPITNTSTSGTPTAATSMSSFTSGYRPKNYQTNYVRKVGQSGMGNNLMKIVRQNNFQSNAIGRNTNASATRAIYKSNNPTATAFN